MKELTLYKYKSYTSKKLQTKTAAAAAPVFEQQQQPYIVQTKKTPCILQRKKPLHFTNKNSLYRPSLGITWWMLFVNYDTPL